MRSRSRYIRRVRSVDHRTWRRRVFWAHFEAMVAERVLDDLVYGNMSGEPLGIINQPGIKIVQNLRMHSWGPTIDGMGGVISVDYRTPAGPTDG